MSGTHDEPGDQVDPSRAELEAHIEQTRHDLAETIDALGAKADVKTRARNRVQATKHRAEGALAQGKDALTDERGRVRPVVPAVAGAVLLAVVGALVLRGRRRR